MKARSKEELRHMRAAGRVVAEMHEKIRAAIRPGVTTAALVEGACFFAMIVCLLIVFLVK